MRRHQPGGVEAMAEQVRRRASEILEQSVEGDRGARLVNGGLILLIIANVAAVILESEPSIAAGQRRLFGLFEALSIAVFTLEYGLRVWSAVELPNPRFKHPLWGRLRYAATPLALVDLIAVLPFYLSFILPIDLRTLRVLRLLRLLKLTRYSSAMTLLLEALRDEAHNIGAAVFILVVLLVIAASFAHLAEQAAQPDAFGTIPRAMWWAVITLTTVGYGDVVPITPLGKLVGGLIGIIGIGMVALPAGLLASGFSAQLHRRRQRFETEVNRILANGMISPEEGDHLRTIAERQGLTDREAAEIVKLIIRSATGPTFCPHCGEALTRHQPVAVEHPLFAQERHHPAGKGREDPEPSEPQR